MKTCSYCGHENPDEAAGCSGCGALPVVPRMTEPRLDPMPLAAFPAEDEPQKALCPSCLEPNRQSAGFCENCGGIIGATSGLAPLEAAWNKGHGNPRSLDTHPRPIILIVVWLLFCPSMVWSLLGIASLMSSRQMQVVAAFFIIVLMAWVGLCAYVLVWNTRNYYRRTRASAPAEGDVP